MDDPRWLRVITIGLVLAVISVGYFFISGKFSRSVTMPAQITEAVLPSPTASLSPEKTNSAYNQIVNRQLSNVNTLPNTGFADTSVLLLSLGAVFTGWNLRKYSN